MEHEYNVQSTNPKSMTHLSRYNNGVHSLYPLETEVSCMLVVLTQVAMDRWSGTEEYVGTEVVPPRLAELTHTTRDARFNGHSVTWKKSRV